MGNWGFASLEIGQGAQLGHFTRGKGGGSVSFMRARRKGVRLGLVSCQTRPRPRLGSSRGIDQLTRVMRGSKEPPLTRARWESKARVISQGFGQMQQEVQRWLREMARRSLALSLSCLLISIRYVFLRCRMCSESFDRSFLPFLQTVDV